MSLRPRHDPARQLGETVRSNLKPAERVTAISIKPSRYQQEIWREFPQRRRDPLVPSCQKRFVPGPWGERTVDCETQPNTLSTFVCRTSSRIKRCLMNASVENIISAPKNFLGPVAVVDIPIQNCYALYACIESLLGS